MDRQTEGQTYSSNYNIDIKGYGVVKNLYFLPNLFANSFITWRTVWEFEICFGISGLVLISIGNLRTDFLPFLLVKKLPR